MVTVYFENNICAEKVAVFKDEETYLKSLPILITIAAKSGQIVTESVTDDELL